MGAIIKQFRKVINPNGVYDDFTGLVYKFEKNGTVSRFETSMMPGRTLGNVDIPTSVFKLVTSNFKIDVSFVNKGRGGLKSYRLLNITEFGLAQIDIHRNESTNKTVLRQLCNDNNRKEYDLGVIENGIEYKFSFEFHVDKYGFLVVDKITKNGLLLSNSVASVSTAGTGEYNSKTGIVLHGATIDNPTNGEDANVSFRYFGYTSNTGRILSFDFSGNNEDEALTDKVSGVKLLRGGAIKDTHDQVIFPYYSIR